MGALALCGPGAAAQTPFEASTLSSTSLNAQDHAAIRTFLDEVERGLTSDDAVTVTRAKSAAVSELSRSEIRVPFRVDFSKAAVGRLEPLLRHENELVAINAAYVVGEIGTGESANALVRALGDEREAVRYALAVALERNFVTKSPAQIPGGTLRVIEGILQNQLRTEQSTRVLAAHVRTLASAADPRPREGLADDVRPMAMRLLGQELSTRAPKGAEMPADAALMDAMLHAALSLREEVTRVGNQPTQEQKLDAVRLAGHLLAYVVGRVEAGNIGVNDAMSARPERADLTDLARLGEQIIRLSRLPGAQLPAEIPPPKPDTQRGLEGLVQVEEDEAFVDEAMQFIGPDGALTKPPFNFPKSEFIK